MGGVEARAKYYYKHLTEMGHKVFLAVLSKETGMRVEGIRDADLLVLPSSGRMLLPSLLKVLRWAVKMHSDSVFLLTGGITLFGLLLLIFTVRRMRRAIFIYGKDVLASRGRILHRILCNLTLTFSPKICVNSKATGGLIPRWAVSKVRLLYPGVDVEVLKRVGSGGGMSGGERRILFVGRLVRRKGADDLIKAFHALLKDLPEAVLEIVGDGPEMLKLRMLTRELGVEGRVRFLGELIGVPLCERYRDCDVFCMPSKTLRDDVEGFGIVFLEAGLFGKPSVGTWSGGIPEAVIHGQTGILVKEGDVEALKDALMLLLTDRSLAEQMGANARRRVLNEFTWRKATEALIDIFSG